MVLRIKTPLLFCALAMLGSVFLFQNCTGGISFTGQSLGVNPQGGAGSDGMIARSAFQSLKTCANGDVSVGATIEIKEFKDSKELYLTRKDCQDLAPAEKLDASALEFAMDDSSVFVYQNEIFDLRTGDSHQRVTTNICNGTSPRMAAGGQLLARVRISVKAPGCFGSIPPGYRSVATLLI